ncbi:cation channel family protein (macronuclear) [Tetrahymena thermophila SB210]|uniref:Cation channel family protein n=1 Tax=Tetrahymena thermophila (strain SB210) TaxID=312017 RepID=W7XA05_TETTS|nr:cation channel family protein [Tetrahymena thermophila SB210]EWS74162.1 cation channel family protein [Tetrahymena thermophila SB210]|eukprot:XP_012653302.1 cation channel family protein [Tetrahymena thermophila SB210]
MSTQQTAQLPQQLIQMLKQMWVKESADKKSWDVKLASKDFKLTNAFNQALDRVCKDGYSNVEKISLSLVGVQQSQYEQIGGIFYSFNHMSEFNIDVGNFTHLNQNIFLLPNLKKLNLTLGTAESGESILIGLSLALQQMKLLESLTLQIGESGLVGQFCENLGQTLLSLKNLYHFSLTILSFNRFYEQYFEILSRYLQQHNQIQSTSLHLKYCNQYSHELNETKNKIILNLNSSDTILNAKIEFEYGPNLIFSQVNLRKSEVYKIIVFQTKIASQLFNNQAMILTDLYY